MNARQRLYRQRKDIAQPAHTAVARAIRHGLLKPAYAFKCTDCDKQAQCYDHRDYDKPLEVEPVCISCNYRRGPAIQTAPLRRNRWTPATPQQASA
jgi:hypothetical protein